MGSLWASSEKSGQNTKGSTVASYTSSEAHDLNFELGLLNCRVVAGKTKVFSIPSWKYNFNQESTNLGEFQYTLGQKVYNSDSPKFGYL